MKKHNEETVSLSGMVACRDTHLVRIKLLRRSEHRQGITCNRRLAPDKAPCAPPRECNANGEEVRILQAIPKRLVIGERRLQRARQSRKLRVRVAAHRVLHVGIHVNERLADEMAEVRPRLSEARVCVPAQPGKVAHLCGVVRLPRVQRDCAAGRRTGRSPRFPGLDLLVYEVLEDVGDVRGRGERFPDFAEVLDRTPGTLFCRVESAVRNARARYGLDGCDDEDGGRGGNDLDHGDGNVTKSEVSAPYPRQFHDFEGSPVAWLRVSKKSAEGTHQ